MRDLVSHLAALDPDAAATVKVIAYFDQLVEAGAGLEPIVRGAAVLAGCPARLADAEHHVRLRVEPDGRAVPAETDPDPAWPSTPVRADGPPALWLERPGPGGVVDAMVLERAAAAARGVLDRTRGRPAYPDPATVEAVLDPTVDEKTRLRLARRLGLGATARAVARPGGRAELAPPGDWPVSLGVAGAPQSSTARVTGAGGPPQPSMARSAGAARSTSSGARAAAGSATRAAGPPQSSVASSADAAGPTSLAAGAAGAASQASAARDASPGSAARTAASSQHSAVAGPTTSVDRAPQPTSSGSPAGNAGLPHPAVAQRGSQAESAPPADRAANPGAPSTTALSDLPQAGLGPVVPIRDLPASWAAARIALRFTAAGTEADPGPRVVDFADLGGLAVLADAVGPSTPPVADVEAVEKARAAAPWVLETLVAVARAASLRAAAAALTLHHSTLQERLTHAEHLLGWSVRTPHGRLRLQLALALRRLHRNP
ncbi:MAG TPA: helix-turn-helix domain-containing protein [Amycolatopsis sp.]